MNSYLAPSNVDWHSLLGVDNTYQLLSGSNSVSRWCTGSFYTVVLNICAAPVQICYSLKEMCNVHTPATLLCTVYLFSFNNSLRLCVTITAKTICQILSFRKGKKDDLSNFKLACFWSVSETADLLRFSCTAISTIGFTEFRKREISSEWLFWVNVDVRGQNVKWLRLL